VAGRDQEENKRSGHEGKGIVRCIGGGGGREI
jgi:hypothetical protein